MGNKVLLSFIFFLVLTFLGASYVFAQETITITTYYPAPFGVYREIRSTRMAIGDDYVDNSSDYCWPPEVCVNAIDANADLIVEGNVGIGTWSPQATLDVWEDGGTIMFPRKSTTGDPSGINGMIYYNEADGKFRVYENGAWRDLAIGMSSCIVKSRSTNPSGGDPVFCDPGTVRTGGGCQPSSGGNVTATAPATNGWSCSGSGTMTTFVICCL